MPNATIAQPAVRIAGAFSFIFFSTMGIILNLLLMIVLYKGRKSFKLNAFFIITWQLIICDILAHLIDFIVGIPITLAGFDIYGGNLIHLVPCFFETFSYFGTLFFSFLMTLNRITVLIAPKISQILFQNYLYVPITFIWVFNMAFCISYNYFACYKTFNSVEFHYQHNCPAWNKSNRFGEFLALAFANSSNYLPIAMFIAYLVMIIFIKFKLNYEYQNGKILRRKTSQGGRSSLAREFQLLAQAFVICGVLEVENVVFQTLPYIQTTGQWIFLINFTGSCTSLFLNCIHPIVLFSFNKDIQHRLKTLLQSGTGSVNPILTVTQTNSRHK